MEFSRMLKEIRLEKGLTQLQLAKLLKASDSSVRHWENHNVQPNYETLCKLAKIFEVTVGQLLGVEEY